MDKANGFGTKIVLNEVNMKKNGKMIYNMSMELKHGMMEINIKVTI